MFGATRRASRREAFGLHHLGLGHLRVDEADRLDIGVADDVAPGDPVWLTWWGGSVGSGDRLISWPAGRPLLRRSSVRSAYPPLKRGQLDPTFAAGHALELLVGQLDVAFVDRRDRVLR